MSFQPLHRFISAGYLQIRAVTYRLWLWSLLLTILHHRSYYAVLFNFVAVLESMSVIGTNLFTSGTSCTCTVDSLNRVEPSGRSICLLSRRNATHDRIK